MSDVSIVQSSSLSDEPRLAPARMEQLADYMEPNPILTFQMIRYDAKIFKIALMNPRVANLNTKHSR